MFAREDHFQPDMQGMNERTLGEASLFQLRQNTDRVAFEYCATSRISSRASKLTSAVAISSDYLGWVNYAAQFGPAPDASLEALYAEVMGENSAGKLTTARERIRPNAFGCGEPDIQRGPLTSAELQFLTNTLLLDKGYNEDEGRPDNNNSCVLPVALTAASATAQKPTATSPSSRRICDSMAERRL